METPPLVGRELDLAVALEQLKRIERGAPSSLLVRGDAGIGKSRLVTELVTRARQLGHRTVAGRADDLDHGIPYAVFRDLLARLPPDDLDPEEAGLVNAFRRGLAGDDAQDDDEAGLSAVFAGAVRFFRAMAEQGPTVLVVEDLHVADRDSLALVALLVRLADVPMLTVVTLRPGAEASGDVERLLDEMAFDGRGAVIDLEPLDRHETQALVAAVLGAAADEALGAAVFEASGGNPFFAREMTQSFADGGAVVVDGGRARLVRDAPAVGLRPSTALLRRLFAGTLAGVEVAKVMAVFGRFSLRHLPLVERLTGQSADEAARSFDQLVKAGLLQETADGGYEFTHSIVRDTLYDDIGPAERRRIHAAVATELATERRAGMVLDVLELATHVAASAEPGDEDAAAVLLEAGRAVAARAPLVSAEHHRRAVDLLPAGSPLRFDAMANQARALHAGSRPAEAAAVGRRALEGLPQGAARQAVAALVVNDLYIGCEVEEALRVVEAELAAGGAACPLLAIQVNVLFQGGRVAEAAGRFGDAVAALGGGAAAQLMALAHLVQYANHTGQVDVAADLLARLLELPRDASPTVQLAVHELAAFADWRPGLVPRVEEHLAAARRLRPDPAALSIGGSFESAQTRLHWIRGEWDDALAFVRRTSFDLEQRGSLAIAQLQLCAGCEILVDRGAVDEAAAVEARLVTPIAALARNVAFVRARLRHAVGDRDGAEALLLAERAAATGGSVWKVADVLGELVDLYVEGERTGEARAVAVELDELAGRVGWIECQLPALRASAVAHADVDAARAYGELAEREGWEVERARALLVRGELGDDPGANLTQAYRLFDSFGAAPWRRRAAAGLRTRGLTVPRRVAQGAAGLTETEVQLVRLVGEGLSNREIATAMHYSPKTIEVYLSRVYAKTGCASRLELIRAVDTGAVDVRDA